MKVAIIDKIILDNDNRKRLEKVGDLEIYENDTTCREEVIKRLHDADIGIISLSKIDYHVLKKCPKLKMLSLYSTGFDHVNVEDLNRANFIVSNVPDFSSISVAEHVFAMLLTLIRHTPNADKHVRNGEYDWYAFRGLELCGKTLGIYGTGAIGCHVAEIGHGFGMRVIATSRTGLPEKATMFGFTYVPFDVLLEQSDFLSVNCILTEETRKRFSREEFSRMKSSAVFINTARGAVADYDALAHAVRNNVIAGACLDVFPEEPPKSEWEIFHCPNVVVSPHIAYNTHEAVERLTTICVDNIINFLAGKPSNIVNKPQAAR